jgi:hypothetical protein
VWKEKEVVDPNASGLRKISSAEAGLAEGEGTELDDTISSPLKLVAEEADVNHGKSNTKKQLLLESAVHVEAADKEVPPPPAYVTSRDQKKQNKTDKGGVDTRTQAKNGAGSDSGPSQPQ